VSEALGPTEAAAPADARRVAAPFLDAPFYLAQAGEEASADPVGHYLTTGWRYGADPAPWFSTRRYLADHPDVREAGSNPFHHFIAHGLAEGRGARAVQGDAPALTERDAVAQAFDARFYALAYPDVAGAGLDPLEHFLAWGWREGRDPTRDFSVMDYLDQYGDVLAAGVNPFTHYLLAGRRQGRATRSGLGFRAVAARRLRPLTERILRILAAPAQTSDPQDLLRALQALPRRPLHVTFSHDDYTRTCGGMQICIQREVAAMRSLGFDSLHLHPAAPFPTVRDAHERLPLGVVLNGTAIGTWRAADIAAALRSLQDRRPSTLAVHSLVGHEAGETADLICALDPADRTWWIHDFAALCAGVHLMRNDVADCGAPAPDSGACGICVHEPRRALQLRAHRSLHQRFDFRVAAPSAGALDLWRRAGHSFAEGVVLPHVWLKGRARRRPCAAGPLRVAYVGAQALHKGWPAFLDLARARQDDPRYAFHTFGAAASPRLDCPHHPVEVTIERPSAMAQALEAQAVDIVVLWSLCQETFSLAAMEALAAGAVIVTHPDSGNIAAIVRETGLGVVLADEAALEAWFENGDALRFARETVPAPRALAFSALTADLFDRSWFDLCEPRLRLGDAPR
jgi:hypothetical protein